MGGVSEAIRRSQEFENLNDGALSFQKSNLENTQIKQQIDEILGIKPYLSSAHDQSYTLENLSGAMNALSDNRFLLPTQLQTERLFDVMNGHVNGGMQAHYANRLPSAQHAMIAMDTPWLDTLRPEGSIRGFTELQAIGRLLKEIPPFDDEFSKYLRDDFGDWRNPINHYPPGIFYDENARHNFYVQRGLNTELTNFPIAAFYECLVRSGIKTLNHQLLK